MKIAIIGYGKMGRAIEAVAKRRNHEIVCTIDTSEELAAKLDQLRLADVAVEFTTPSTAVENLYRCFEVGLPVVCGTTGWYDHYSSVADRCQHLNATLLAATNFSIGMNIMFALNKRLAQIMTSFEQYSPSITETHHVHKLDAPSGTAITLKNQITAVLPREIEITSVREGEIAGIHTVCYQSPEDTISITHEAHGREGLALGAVLAAEFIRDKHGIFTLDDMLKL